MRIHLLSGAACLALLPAAVQAEDAAPATPGAPAIIVTASPFDTDTPTIVALLFQSLITQSHLHPISPFGRTSHTGVFAATRIGHHALSPSGDCAICREIAQAGQYVASAPPSFDGPASPGFWRSPSVARPVTRHSVSHAWHSRGPPPAAPL